MLVGVKLLLKMMFLLVLLVNIVQTDGSSEEYRIPAPGFGAILLPNSVNKNDVDSTKNRLLIIPTKQDSIPQHAMYDKHSSNICDNQTVPNTEKNNVTPWNKSQINDGIMMRKKYSAIGNKIGKIKYKLKSSKCKLNGNSFNVIGNTLYSKLLNMGRSYPNFVVTDKQTNINESLSRAHYNLTKISTNHNLIGSETRIDSKLVTNLPEIQADVLMGINTLRNNELVTNFNNSTHNQDLTLNNTRIYQKDKEKTKYLHNEETKNWEIADDIAYHSSLLSHEHNHEMHAYNMRSIHRRDGDVRYETDHGTRNKKLKVNYEQRQPSYKRSRREISKSHKHITNVHPFSDQLPVEQVKEHKPDELHQNVEMYREEWQNKSQPVAQGKEGVTEMTRGHACCSHCTHMHHGNKNSTVTKLNNSSCQCNMKMEHSNSNSKHGKVNSGNFAFNTISSFVDFVQRLIFKHRYLISEAIKSSVINSNSQEDALAAQNSELSGKNYSELEADNLGMNMEAYVDDRINLATGVVQNTERKFEDLTQQQHWKSPGDDTSKTENCFNCTLMNYSENVTSSRNLQFKIEHPQNVSSNKLFETKDTKNANMKGMWNNIHPAHDAIDTLSSNNTNFDLKYIRFVNISNENYFHEPDVMDSTMKTKNSTLNETEKPDNLFNRIKYTLITSDTTETKTMTAQTKGTTPSSHPTVVHFDFSKQSNMWNTGPPTETPDTSDDAEISPITNDGEVLKAP
ncbi:MATH and LRR domain-containing protein PFE0570w-like [Periplaneta americana]|uniref:MATH and LRR domain-containing protein PFE0570w-like n=1 Tax=Periplaneta americana TaxID=6978 RepID=UPI0037E7F4A8